MGDEATWRDLSARNFDKPACPEPLCRARRQFLDRVDRLPEMFRQLRIANAFDFRGYHHIPFIWGEGREGLSDKFTVADTLLAADLWRSDVPISD